MENFFIDYRDPIFGLIVFMSAVFMIAFFSFAWGIIGKKDEQKKIKNFIKKFETNSEFSAEYKKILQTMDINSILILAKMFVKSGDFEKAIALYLILLEKISQKDGKTEILTELGKVYFKTGLMHRAEDVLLQTLQFKARNPDALMYLMYIYENLKKFDKANDVLDALLEQGIDVSASRLNVKLNQILSQNLSPENKILALSEINLVYARRKITEIALENGINFTQIMFYPKIKEIVDILWHSDKIANINNKEFKALYYAKGARNDFENSEIFEINVLCELRKNGIKNGDLKFSYMCENCKNSLPFFMMRCPICNDLSEKKIFINVVRKNSEDSETF